MLVEPQPLRSRRCSVPRSVLLSPACTPPRVSTCVPASDCRRSAATNVSPPPSSATAARSTSTSWCWASVRSRPPNGSRDRVSRSRTVSCATAGAAPPPRTCGGRRRRVLAGTGRWAQAHRALDERRRAGIRPREDHHGCRGRGGRAGALLLERPVRHQDPGPRCGHRRRHGARRTRRRPQVPRVLRARRQARRRCGAAACPRWS